MKKNSLAERSTEADTFYLLIQPTDFEIILECQLKQGKCSFNKNNKKKKKLT